jgi:hypothetical protein
MLLHDLKINFDKYFIVFDFPKTYKDAFVIRVDLKSKYCNEIALLEFKNFIIPLSVNKVHFERLRDLNEVKN